MFLSYLKLTAAALIPAVATAILYRLDCSGRFRALSRAKKQFLFGLVFGAIASLGTEWGISLEGAVVNCRDAAPLCAGLFFGGPAGIIAGCIGGLERWLSVYWGAGSYTRLACSISTVLAGVIAALLRKHIFESRRPKLLLACINAFLVETLHQSMVFFLHLNDAAHAAEIVRITAPVMLPANTLSVLFAGIVYAFLDGSLFDHSGQRIPLSMLIEKKLLIPVVISFVFTTAFAYKLQTDVAKKQTEKTLRQTLQSISASLNEPSETSESDLKSVPISYPVGNNEHFILLDRSGRIRSLSSGTLPEEDVASMLPENEETFDCRLYGKPCIALSQPAGEYRIVAAVPTSEVYSVRNVTVLATCFVQVFIYGLLFSQISFRLRKTVVNSIRGTNETLSQIASGNLEAKVEQRNSMEFSYLSDGINATVNTLKSYIEEEKAHNERELAVAREIQLSALPHTFPAYPKRTDLDIFALTQPAREVGGDFYDFYFANDGRFYILIADVSGKGIPAAMFMMRAKTQLKGLIETGNSIDEAFRLTNSAICEGNDAEMFVTAWMAEIDMETKTLVFVNAGHNPPAVLSSNGSFELLKTRPDFVLGGMDGTCYSKQTRQLHAGDRIVLYTDGITEAVDPRNELFGEKRLLALLNGNKKLAAASLGKAILQGVLAFSDTAEQADDITLLIFDILGSGTVHEKHFDTAVTDDIPIAVSFLEEELNRLGCSEKIRLQMDIALDEIFSNIVKYAYPYAPGPVTLRLEESDNPRSVICTFIDKGIPFNPLEAAEPNITLKQEERSPGGLGIFLVKEMMDEVSYEYMNGQNVLRLKKSL